MKKLFAILAFVGLGLFFVPETSAQNFFDDEVTVKDGIYDETETCPLEFRLFEYTQHELITGPYPHDSFFLPLNKHC